MILTFDNSIDCYLQENKDKLQLNSPIIILIKEIFRSMMKQYHIVSLRRNTIDILRKFNFWEYNDYRALIILEKNVQNHKIILSLVDRYLNIYYEHQNNQNQWNLDIKDYFNQIERFEMHRSALITENPDDYNLYEILFEYYIRNFREYDSIHFNMQNFSGYGGNIRREIQSRITNNFCLSIADSDKKHCEDTIKSTAKQIMEIRTGKNQIYDYHILDVKEKENIFSAKVINSIFDNNNKLLLFIASLSEVNDVQFLKFISLSSKGLKFSSFRKFPEHIKKIHLEYYKRMNDAQILKVNYNDLVNYSLQDEQKIYCENTINILYSALKKVKNSNYILMETKGESEVVNGIIYLNSYLYTEWNKIVKKMLDFGITYDNSTLINNG